MENSNSNVQRPTPTESTETKGLFAWLPAKSKVGEIALDKLVVGLAVGVTLGLLASWYAQKKFRIYVAPVDASVVVADVSRYDQALSIKFGTEQVPALVQMKFAFETDFSDKVDVNSINHFDWVAPQDWKILRYNVESGSPEYGDFVRASLQHSVQSVASDRLVFKFESLNPDAKALVTVLCSAPATLNRDELLMGSIDQLASGVAVIDRLSAYHPGAVKPWYSDIFSGRMSVNVARSLAYFGIVLVLMIVPLWGVEFVVRRVRSARLESRMAEREQASKAEREKSQQALAERFGAVAPALRRHLGSFPTESWTMDYLQKSHDFLRDLNPRQAALFKRIVDEDLPSHSPDTILCLLLKKLDADDLRVLSTMNPPRVCDLVAYRFLYQPGAVYDALSELGLLSELKPSASTAIS